MKKKLYIVPVTTILPVCLEQAFMQTSANPNQIFVPQDQEEEEGEDQFQAW